MDQELSKLAAAAIKQLQVELTDLKEENDLLKGAVKLAFELYHEGLISTEQLEKKISEFSLKSKSELEIVKQASVYTKTAVSLNSFKLSNANTVDNSTPAERFISFLMED